jgi:oxysterol-binding protein-related protein 8
LIKEGCAKPYNPILGEIFNCSYQLDDGSTSEYFSEQVSHHPPITSIYFKNEKNQLEVQANVSPVARIHIFSNSATIAMKGEYNLKVGENEVYRITPPVIQIKNIFWGKLKMGYTGKSSIICEQTGFQCVTKWNFDEVEMKIFKNEEHISTVSGNLHEEIQIRDVNGYYPRPFYNSNSALKLHKEIISIPEYEESESRKYFS